MALTVVATVWLGWYLFRESSVDTPGRGHGPLATA